MINVIEDGTFTHEHVSMQGTLAREHIGTKANWHARQIGRREYVST